MVAYDVPITAGREAQLREFFVTRIVEKFPERATDPNLIYGNPELEYYRLVNEGVIQGGLDAVIPERLSETSLNNKISKALEPYAKKSALAMNALDYGVKGDGITDDSDAIRDVILRWHNVVTGAVLNRPVDLVFPARTYQCNKPIVINNTTHSAGGRISAVGANFNFLDGIGYGLTFDATPLNKDNLQMTLDGLTFTNAGLRLKGGIASGYMYGWKLDNISCRNVAGAHGILVDGPFEGQMYSPIVQMKTTETVFNAIHVEAVTAGDTSSIEIYSATTRGGQHGIKTNLADAKIFGGTTLQSKKEGVYIDNSEGGVISGHHVEQAWMGQPKTGIQAGIRMVGSGHIDGVHVLNSVSGTTHAVRTYASQRIVITSGLGYDLTDFAYIDGAQDSTVTLIGTPGNPGYSADYSFLNVRNGNIIKLGGNTMFQIDGTAKKVLGAAATDAATTTTLVNNIRTALQSLGLVG